MEIMVERLGLIGIDLLVLGSLFGRSAIQSDTSDLRTSGISSLST